MKKRWISIVAVMAFVVLVAGAAYAHVDRHEWCTGNSGWSHMMGSYMGNMMGSSAGHMTGPSIGHMKARHDGKDQSYNCPGWDIRNQDTGDQNNGNKDTGNNK